MKNQTSNELVRSAKITVELYNILLKSKGAIAIDYEGEIRHQGDRIRMRHLDRFSGRMTDGFLAVDQAVAVPAALDDDDAAFLLVYKIIKYSPADFNVFAAKIKVYETDGWILCIYGVGFDDGKTTLGTMPKNFDYKEMVQQTAIQKGTSWRGTR